MRYDLNETADWQPRPHYDFCIAGAGPAGIVLAAKLAAAGRSVLLLEAGDAEPTAAAAAFTGGENVGHPNVPLARSRLRALGGASNHWGGWCRTLSPIDFARRPGLPLTGWPFGAEALAPYLDEAARWLGIAPPGPDGAPLAAADGQLQAIALSFSRPPMNFARAQGEALAASPAVDLLLNASLVALDLDRESGLVARCGFRSPTDPTLRWATAGRVVLAAGGIENARLLLHFDRALAATGNGGGRRLGGAWVGRYYMQHLHGSLGGIERLEGVGEAAPRVPDMLWGSDGGLRFYAASPALMTEAGSGAVRLYARPEPCPHAGGVPAPWDLLAAVGCRLRPLGSLRATGEQLPDPDSRVLLADSLDALGLPRLRLDWRPRAADKRSLRLAATAFATLLAGQGLRLRLADWLLRDDADFPPPDGDNHGDLGAASHHMGTTRLAASERDGVADPDARVFGTRNLYLAGSSLFPTGGHANPTLPLLQLTLRLADHLLRSA